MIDPRVEQLLSEVERQAGLPPSADRDFREAVKISYLASAMTRAVKRSDLSRLVPRRRT